MLSTLQLVQLFTFIIIVFYYYFFKREVSLPFLLCHCHHINFLWDILKIEAVTRRILWIKHTDPIAKILVFSSWNDVLDVLEHAFTANDISFIRMKGGR